jgi:hypothetical protein
MISLPGMSSKRMSHDQEHRPGDCTPVTGRYEELNVFGTRTGKTVHVEEGEPLPAAPCGYTWRRILPSRGQI